MRLPAHSICYRRPRWQSTENEPATPWCAIASGSGTNPFARGGANTGAFLGSTSRFREGTSAPFAQPTVCTWASNQKHPRTRQGGNGAPLKGEPFVPVRSLWEAAGK
ncbi:hypothetical protein TRVL_06511 [Trypanosoma vivax]|nr:hypothetical protein TRVL_06511 [Trypanosoma vivax]